MDTETLDLSAFSMLAPSAMERLEFTARQAAGGILEIGAYMGGSTIAIARGNQRRRPHAVIEAGGSHDHPTIPSSDIVADWRRNLEAFGYADAVTLCQGWSYDPAIQQAAIETAGPVGLMFIDADGFVAATLAAFAKNMTSDCMLVIDDYLAPGAEEKAALVKPYVDAQVEAGRLAEIAIEGGTWFGRVTGRAALATFASTPPVKRNGGHCLLTPVRNSPVFDVANDCRRSPMRLFEDGVELGPAHAPHQEIRDFGGGRFSQWESDWDRFWQRWLYWSTSDNSDPMTNGRTYEADWGAGRVGLHLI